MAKRRVLVEEGIDEVGEYTFRCVMNALHKIAASDDACCRGCRRRGAHTPSCPVAVARRALRDAAHLSAAFPGHRLMTLDARP